MNLSNMPELKLGIVAVSRDCFPMSLSENRRKAVVEAYKKNFSGEIFECPTVVESETDMLKAAKELREAGVTYKVYKNTMMNFAFKGTDYESLAPVLEGPSAIAISTEDATAPARILAKFAKTAPALEIKAGVVEGTFYDANGMQAVAAVPSRDELLSKLLGSLQSPITNLARVLNQIAEQGGEAPATEE